MSDETPIAVHTYPQDDDILHLTDGEPCPCSPNILEIDREDGTTAYQVVHNMVRSMPRPPV